MTVGVSEDIRAVMAMAQQQIAEITGMTIERVVGLERNDQGWVLECEVVERDAIPTTMDVLGLYEFELDPTGAIRQFRRKSSRHRGDVIESG